jgi:antitoxin CptB
MRDRADLRRLRWRCRRGMRELDQLLVRWLDGPGAHADAIELAGFEALLEVEDSDLWRWLSGRAEPAREDWRNLIARIRSPA